MQRISSGSLSSMQSASSAGSIRLICQASATFDGICCDADGAGQQSCQQQSYTDIAFLILRLCGSSNEELYAASLILQSWKAMPIVAGVMFVSFLLTLACFILPIGCQAHLTSSARGEDYGKPASDNNAEKSNLVCWSEPFWLKVAQ